MRVNIEGANGGRRLRVLVVDDYPDAAETTCMLLKILGHDTRAAYSGQHALDVAREYDPEVALIDLDLPDVPGLEVGRALRSASPRPVHLAAITGWSDLRIRAGVSEAGFDQFIVKPTTKLVLESILSRASCVPASPRRPRLETTDVTHAAL